MLAGALILLALVAGGAYWGGDFFARFRPGAPLAERELSEIKTVGVVSGETEMPITANVSGVIAAVSCDIGSIVKAGQVCAEIDSRPYRLIVERSDADLTLANGRLTKAKAQLARAQATYDRAQNLSNRKAIASSALTAAQKVLEQRQADVVRAEASVALIEAALIAAQRDLEHTSILSPIEGTVVARDVRTGQAVVAGHPLFRVVADPRLVKIRVSVDERVASALRVGDAVSFSVERAPDYRFEGQVTQISIDPRATETARKYDVVVTATNPDLRLAPGMSTTIRMTPRSRAAPAARRRHKSPSQSADDAVSQKRRQHTRRLGRSVLARHLGDGDNQTGAAAG